MSILWSLQHALQFQMPVGGAAVFSLSSRGTSGERAGERGFLCSVPYGFLSIINCNLIMIRSPENCDTRTHRRIKCTAPIRICDLGGWTDTWFAGRGSVVNIAVFPSVEVTVDASSRKAGQGQITIFAENYNERYDIETKARTWTKHPLIEAAFQLFKLPDDLHLDVTIFSEAPVGASTGTSAAVSVALLGALDLLGGRSLTSHEIASKAHHIESELLGIQSGIQDQISSAYGGINFIEMTKYPEASVSSVSLAEELLWELQSRLVLIYLGKPHSSAAIHDMVIRRLEESPRFRRCLEPLREAAMEGKTALLRGNLDLFGQAMIENTRAQELLHSDLVGERAKQVIALARQLGVAGYKINGAGGDGGSITLLLRAGAQDKHDLIREIETAHPEFRHIAVWLAPQGLRRWSTENREQGKGLHVRTSQVNTHKNHDRFALDKQIEARLTRAWLHP
jgi:D-glycero-alpha-D-manno-heptose-7-phosphate kinase